MSQQVRGPIRTFNGAATGFAQYTRVKLAVVSGILVLAQAGVTDKEIGVTAEASFGTNVVDNEKVPVILRSAEGTTKMVATGAITQGAEVYSAAAGQISSTQATGALDIGISLDGAVGAGGITEVLRNAYEH